MNIYSEIRTKVCSKCNTEKPLDQFSKRTKSADGYRTICKLCVKEYNAEHTQDRAKARTKYNNLNAPTITIKKAKYRESNKDKIREYGVAYRKKTNAAQRAKKAKRRATKLQATPGWYEHNEVQAIYTEAKLTEIKTGIQHHVDHIVPLQSDLVCGLHCLANLQIITASENCSKSNIYWPDMP